MKPQIYPWTGLLVFLAFTVWVTAVAARDTERVINLRTGLKVGGQASDRIGFYDATPTPKPVDPLNAPVNATPLPTPAGTPSQTGVTNAIVQLNADTVLLNQIAANLAAQGLMATPTPTPSATATFTPTPTPTP